MSTHASPHIASPWHEPIVLWVAATSALVALWFVIYWHLPVFSDWAAAHLPIILGERQLGDRELVSDRARVFFGYLGLEKIADQVLRLMLALERRGVDLVVGALHSVELEFAHHFEEVGSLHGHTLLSWS